MTPTHDERDFRVLQEALADALEGVGSETGEAIAALRNRAKRNRQFIWTLVATVAATLVALAAVTVLALSVRSNTEDIDRVQHRTSDKVLCPLYDVFLQGEHSPIAKLKTPGETDAQYRKRLADRAAAYKVIHQGYDELKCSKD